MRSILSTQFLSSYSGRTVNWGFPSGPNYLGELVYRRTYRRGNEQWKDTVERVVEGTFEIIERHHHDNGISYDHRGYAEFAQEMYERIFTFKFLPPGRGLWLMGTDFVKTKGGAGLNNCAFISTEHIDTDPTMPFVFLMDMSMLGVGVGFDVRGAGKLTLGCGGYGYVDYTIPDSREGWVESLRLLLMWAFGVGPFPNLNYDFIRPFGSPIKGFGGVASGPGPLKELHERIIEMVNNNAGHRITSRHIVDIMNMIGACVVAGNVRRTAEIAFGDPDDVEYLDLKDYDKNPERGAWGWTSNNSLFCKVGQDYSNCAKRTRMNGEPGYAWLENMQAFGRMCEPANWLDILVKGGNPCLEQSLEHGELCCLVEKFPHHHESLDDFKKTAFCAWLYAKAVTLVPTHWQLTNDIITRNRRIGSSMSGITQFLHYRGEEEFIRWCNETYETIKAADVMVSASWRIAESIKKTSVKPSGTVSLLAGAKPGCHYGVMSCYIRRVRYPVTSLDWQALSDAGYHVEPAIVGYEDYPGQTKPIYDRGTMIVEFPVCDDDDMPTERDVTLEHKVEIAVMLQRYWADNQVSCTATFLPHEGDQIEGLLMKHDNNLKGISFLPLKDEQLFPQMPYEAISRDEYKRRTESLLPVVWSETASHLEEEKGCEAGLCLLSERKAA